MQGASPPPMPLCFQAALKEQLQPDQINAQTELAGCDQLQSYGTVLPYANSYTDWMPDSRQSHMQCTYPPPAPHLSSTKLEFPRDVYENWSGDRRQSHMAAASSAPAAAELKFPWNVYEKLSGHRKRRPIGTEQRALRKLEMQNLQAARHQAMALGVQLEPPTVQQDWADSRQASALESMPHCSYNRDFSRWKQGSNKIPRDLWLSQKQHRAFSGGACSA